MREACDHARITPAVGFHTLRHTWASLAVMARVPLLVVAKNLGHKGTCMVEHHYGHLARSFITEAILAGARVYGIELAPGWTWVQPYERGTPDDFLLRYLWQVPWRLGASR